MNSKKVSGVKKIAVLRSNALGDLIFIMPALTALRETYPKAEIVLLGKPWHQEFWHNRPGPIDRIIVVPVSQGVREEKDRAENRQELEKFFEDIRREQFDIAIQLHGGGKYSNPFLLNLGAKLTVGLKTPDAKPLNRSIPYIYYQNEYLRYLEVISHIGATTSNIEPRINVTDQDLKEARQALGKTNKPLAILHPGASDIRRRWSPEHFAQVGDYLRNKGYRVIVTGVDDEKGVVSQVIKVMKNPGENFCNKLSINGLTGLLSLADIVISNDTGPLHLAEGLNTKTVGIFWCGNLINAGSITRRNHRSLLSWLINCPLCGEDCANSYAFDKKRETICDHQVSFVDKVTIDEVIGQIDDLLTQSVFSEFVQKKIPLTSSSLINNSRPSRVAIGKQPGVRTGQFVR